MPVFKCEDCLEASNYRSTNILPLLSIVAEKVVIEQLTMFLNANNFGLHHMQE